MGTRFTRVTVVGDHRQLDISLPSDAPLAEQLPMVLRLLSVPASPVPIRWALSTPELGAIPGTDPWTRPGSWTGWCCT